MKSLTFRKVDGFFVAEFAATNNFNLHIEGVIEGNVRLYQRGVSGGDYSLVRGLPTYPSYGKIFDCDFTSPVWPKYLKVECATEPVSGYVTESTAVPGGGGGGGSDVVVLNQTKSVSITENGSVSVTADEGFTGLDRVDVDVNVEHVVSNQEKTVDIVANGTTDIVPDAGYDGLGKVSVKVNVPTSGGGGVAPAVYESDVNFRDYDGTLLHSYTKDEFLALSALPELPTREGLICQEWNWDLTEAQDYVADYGILEVGATYITDDGKTRFYISLDSDYRLELPLYFSQTVANGVTIDWGDGSAPETVSGTGNVNTTHKYSSKGEYVVALSVASGCTLGLNSSSGVCGSSSVYISALRKVEFGERVTTIASSGLEKCERLCGVSLPNNIKTIGSYSFRYNNSLEYISIPRGVTAIQTSAFIYCESLSYISLPNTLGNLQTSLFESCTALRTLTIPKSVTGLGDSCCKGCSSLKSLSMPSTITTVSYYAFQGCGPLGRIYVPTGASGANYMYKFCSGATGVVEIEEGFTTVGIEMFCGCSSLSSIIIPKSLKEIKQAGFQSCSSLALVDFRKSESVVQITGSSAFASIASDCKIVVPDALYDEWIAATNWTYYASYIVKASEYYGGSTITFTIDGAEYQATEGMTWGEWLESEYNVEGFYLVEGVQGTEFGVCTRDEPDPMGFGGGCAYYVAREISYDALVDVSDSITAGYEYVELQIGY